MKVGLNEILRVQWPPIAEKILNHCNKFHTRPKFTFYASSARIYSSLESEEFFKDSFDARLPPSFPKSTNFKVHSRLKVKVQFSHFNHYKSHKIKHKTPKICHFTFLIKSTHHKTQQNSPIKKYNYPLKLDYDIPFRDNIMNEDLMIASN